MHYFIFFCLSIILYFIIFLIGNNSNVFGYSSITDVFGKVNYFGFNAVIRIFGPTVYIILLSIIFYLFNFNLVENVWLIAPFYYLISLLWIILLGRFIFLNKLIFFYYFFVGTLVSYLIYVNLITKGLQYILPDFSNFKSELWFIIILFIYKIINNSEYYNYYNSKKTEKYILNNYSILKSKYGFLLDKYDLRFSNIIFSIMILENLNRPLLIRYFENGLFKSRKFLGKNKMMSTGIMQYQCNNLCTDKESIIYAINKLMPIYKKYKKLENYELIDKIAIEYNCGGIYSSSLNDIFCFLPFV